MMLVRTQGRVEWSSLSTGRVRHCQGMRIQGGRTSVVKSLSLHNLHHNTKCFHRQNSLFVKNKSLRYLESLSFCLFCMFCFDSGFLFGCWVRRPLPLLHTHPLSLHHLGTNEKEPQIDRILNTRNFLSGTFTLGAQCGTTKHKLKHYNDKTM